MVYHIDIVTYDSMLVTTISKTISEEWTLVPILVQLAYRQKKKYYPEHKLYHNWDSYDNVIPNTLMSNENIHPALLLN